MVELNPASTWYNVLLEIKKKKKKKSKQTYNKTIFVRFLLLEWGGNLVCVYQTNRQDQFTLSSRCQLPFTVYMKKIKVNWISLVCEMNWNWLSRSLWFCCGCFDHRIVFAEHRAPVAWANLLCFSTERCRPFCSITVRVHDRLNGDIQKWKNRCIKYD